MPVFMSPGVFPTETDLSVLPSALGLLRPAFIGTAKKGVMNTPVLLTSAQNAVDTFGEPFPESYMMYSLVSYFEEGNQAYAMRVGVQYENGMDADLETISIDTSGAKIQGWGRVPVFTGIDNGRINLKVPTVDNPVDFHVASVSNIDYNDTEVGTTSTTATLTFSSQAYTGCSPEVFIVLITGTPTSGDKIDGCTYEVIRNSDQIVVDEGVLADPGNTGTSANINLGNGLIFAVVVSSGTLNVDDTFTFTATPDNKSFAVSVEGAAAVTKTIATGSITTVTAFVAALNAAIGASAGYTAVEYTLTDGTTVPQLVTDTAGERIQLVSTCQFAYEAGVSQYVYDIPRSHLIGTNGGEPSTTSGPYTITSSNNRVKINVIGTATTTIDISIPTGTGLDATDLASTLDAAGTVSGETYFESFALLVPGGDSELVIVASSDHEFDTVQMMANFTNIKTLRFAETVAINYPYTSNYRGFFDSRVALPDSGAVTPETPLSCEVDAGSSQCALDSDYFANIVGWIVATSPGTWIDDYSLSIQPFTEGVGDTAGRYKIIITGLNNVVVEQVNDVTFDSRDARYIGNVINPGTTYGGTNGNAYVNWEERPSYLNNDVNAVDFEVRNPSAINNQAFSGGANGIPTDPAFSTELDAAIIGNVSESTGMYAFQNPEAIDINLLLTPGFSSGSVIGHGLQLCEARGDVLYLIDPPFGLRPQQVVDWHNGILLSDLSAAINSSYGALYWGWVKIFDQFNAQDIWVPPSGHISAVFSRTSRVAEQWNAPAGLRRGRLLTVKALEYNPAVGERDLLYGSGNAVNPIVNFPQDGIVVYGQRTLQRAESMLDRVNVRMLLSYLKKNMIRTLRNYLFEQNDRFTRAQVEATLNPFLGDVLGRRGITAYKVICDESNNTPERVANHQLWVSVFIQPTPVVEFIVLNINILQQSAAFDSAEILAAGGVVVA